MSTSESLGTVNEVTLPQGTIRYRERGTGQPLVFVHGLLVNGDLWRKVVPELSKDFRCITPDWPLGSHELPLNPDADLSPPGVARIVADFLGALDLEDVRLIGNDSGGAVCQLVVTEHPDRIGRLVLTSCDALDVFPPALVGYLPLAARIPGGIRLLTQSLRFRPLRRTPITYGWTAKRQPPREISDGYVRPVLSSAGIRRDVEKFLKDTSRKQTLAAAEKLRSFDRPALIVWAAEDRFFPFRLAEGLAERLPKSRVERVEDSYTFIPEDQPDRLAELVRDFAREPVGEGSSLAGQLTPEQ
jgi:pimeloyl-ACP methyl ester carboxylesterase